MASTPKAVRQRVAQSSAGLPKGRAERNLQTVGGGPRAGGGVAKVGVKRSAFRRGNV